MTKIDPQPTKTGLKIAAVMLALLLSTVAVAPALVGPTATDAATVEDRGSNSVVIDNPSDDPVTATVDAGISTFNTTVDAGDEVIVPANTPDDVTLNT